MASLNKVFLMGNLTRPPELRYTPSGTPVADLRLAVNRAYTTQSGEQRQGCCFLTPGGWGRGEEGGGGGGGGGGAAGRGRWAGGGGPGRAPRGGGGARGGDPDPAR